MALLLPAACGLEEPAVGQLNYESAFAGMIVADEPGAVIASEGVLSAGGSAADAAVAMALNLAVSYPGSAGIGGGGLCLVYDGEAERVQALDFLPGAPTQALAEGGPGQAVAVPGLLRGLFALHARHGRLRFESLLIGPERAARFGSPISRALASDLKAAPAGLADDPATANLFEGRGEPRAVGGSAANLELASLFGRVRGRGVGDFYNGALARDLAAAAGRAGLKLNLADLRDYRPTWHDTTTVEEGYATLHLPPAPYAGHALADLWPRLSDDTDADDAVSQLAATARRLAEERGGTALVGTTSLIAVDSRGDAVACTLTLNAPFGIGRGLPGFGFLPAPWPGDGETPPMALGLAVNENSNEFRLAIAGAHGSDPSAGVGALALAALRGDTKLVSGAQTVGWTSESAPALVNLARCPKSISSHPESCRVGSDPRGNSLGRLLLADD
ncbi:gamma-glutamyltranspeptidase / glutathione hydrolase [Roseospirillum parvum]|uniref:Gamma-glutamyltranspeptidase / glutathione hydrolase n=2 Tax=Roseospirillum parvum TaxID=83401 RepID=A0A1G7XRF0_9PROT|nr:gamma-glutamyltranspeptidase / glutathione hydrolase [Roseospirillum parvum]